MRQRKSWLGRSKFSTGEHQHDLPNHLDSRINSCLSAGWKVHRNGLRQMSYIEQVGLVFVVSVIVLIAFFVLWLLFGRFERACYDKPKPENVDTKFRNKRCDNCRYSEVSTVYPELACPVIGRHVEAHHRCDEWA